MTEAYEDIYCRMKARYEQEIGNTIDEASDAAIRLRVLAGEIYNAQVNLEWVKKQMFAKSASGEYLDKLAEQRGLVRKQAVKAVGTLTFSADGYATHDIFIPSGTTVATKGDNAVRVRTIKDAVLKYGYAAVIVPAEAEAAGYSGNIAGNTAVAAVNMPSEIKSVTNNRYFHGGEDTESDTALRERIRQSYLKRPNGMNEAYYEQLALSVEGISKAGVVSRMRGAGTVNVYVCNGDVEVEPSALEKARAVIAENRELNVDVTVENAVAQFYDLDVKVKAKSGYEAEEVKEKLTIAFREYLNTLPIGGKLYLSALGKYLMDTECIDNYEFGVYMEAKTLSGTQYFLDGDIRIEVV